MDGGELYTALQPDVLEAGAHCQGLQAHFSLTNPHFKDVQVGRSTLQGYVLGTILNDDMVQVGKHTTYVLDLLA